MKNKPFWSLELDYKEALDNLERECREADNLYDALMTGANSIKLNGKYIGCVEENGDFSIIEEPFDVMTDRQLGCVKVEFDGLDRDEDGLTTALFHINKVVDKSKWNLNIYEYVQRWLEAKDE